MEVDVVTVLKENVLEPPLNLKRVVDILQGRQQTVDPFEVVVGVVGQEALDCEVKLS